MASRGKRSAGERVLESKHVIGLFLLMLVFSGVFFTLGYVMGRNQYDGQVRAATSAMSAGTATTDPDVSPKHRLTSKSSDIVPSEADADPATPASPDWEFYGSNKPSKTEPHLDPQPPAPSTSTPPAKALSAKVRVEPTQSPSPGSVPSKSGRVGNAPLIPSGAFVIQVAALKRQDDALAIASSLQKKHFVAYVQPPQKDKFYRVQVGPFKDQKAADAAKKGLESEGFKAFYTKH